MNQTPRRVAVITGASSGIGHITAKTLAARGWDVIAQGRNAERCDAALSDIRQSAAPGVRVAMLKCDLTLLSGVARLADEIAAFTPNVHVLLNNAGGVRDAMHITPEGNEATFAANHLGPFLLTNRLMPLLRRASTEVPRGVVRIVATSSSGHETCPGIDWSDLQQVKNWVSGKNYCLAKLCNLLFTSELARRGWREGIISHAMHPGVVNSNFHAHATPEMQQHMRERPGDPPELSAETLVWLATDPGVGCTTGGYFHNKALVTPSPAALDRDAAARLWQESETLLRRAGY
ncbi:MAG: SDR family NAD(P)-dependent oxidoreductase [Sphingobium sp.]